MWRCGSVIGYIATAATALCLSTAILARAPLDDTSDTADRVDLTDLSLSANYAFSTLYASAVEIDRVADEEGGLALDFSTASRSAAALLYTNQEPQSQPDAPIPEPSDWRFIFQSQWWLPLRIKGPVEVGSTSTDMNIDLRTLLEDLNFVIEGGFELTNDQWSFLVWGVYLNVGTDVSTTLAGGATFDTSLDFKMTIVDMVVAYRVGDWPLESSDTASLNLDLLAGLIVWDTDLEIRERGPLGFDPGISEQDAWVDFIIGGRIGFNISDKFSASLRGEVGGFGIGSSSDLTWNITLVGEYKLSSKVGVIAGYRYLDVDWEQGSGSSRIGYDWAIHGPILGVNIHF